MNIDLNKTKRILIIRLSSLGDILLTTPLVRSLKKQYPSIEIDFLLRKEYEDTYKYNPHLSNYYLYTNENIKSIVSNLKTRNYDLVIDLQNNLRSHKIVNRLDKPLLRFPKRNWAKFLLVHIKINLLKNLPQIPVRYAEIIPGFTLDEQGLDLFIPDEIKPELKTENNYVGLCPGSKHFSKRWPAEYFIRLGNSLYLNGSKVVVFGGREDKSICSKVANAITGAIDLSNDNQLLQTAVNMRQCKTIICNDSGLMHVACSVKVPVITLMGSTVEEFGFTPYRNKNLVLENKELFCRPCSHIGKNKCPEDHFQCMRDLNPVYVSNKAQKFIEGL